MPMITNADRFNVQPVQIKNKNYIIKWLPHAIHKKCLVCLKSSNMEYDAFLKFIRDHCHESSYGNDYVFLKKIEKGTIAEIPMDKVSRPLEIVLLPIKDDMVWLPESEESFKEIAYIYKGTITYYTRLKKPFLGKPSLEMKFTGGNDLLNTDEIIAEYVIEQKRYPVTGKMFDKVFEVQIKSKNTEFFAGIADKYKNKYSVIPEELK